jgi:hypothetical protein
VSTETVDWQQPSLAGLGAVDEAAMPGCELLLLDDLAGFLMGGGPLVPPYTVEHASRVVSALLAAVLNSADYRPEREPVVTEGIRAARQAFVAGAHQFAEAGISGLAQLVNRLIPAVLGELEIYREAPEDQTWSVYYHAILAVASGPLNLLDPAAAAGVTEGFQAWDALFGQGFLPPWRAAATRD